MTGQKPTTISARVSFCEAKRKWKEEREKQKLEAKRELNNLGDLNTLNPDAVEFVPNVHEKSETSFQNSDSNMPRTNPGAEEFIPTNIFNESSAQMNSEAAEFVPCKDLVELSPASNITTGDTIDVEQAINETTAQSPDGPQLVLDAPQLNPDVSIFVPTRDTVDVSPAPEVSDSDEVEIETQVQDNADDSSDLEPNEITELERWRREVQFLRTENRDLREESGSLRAEIRDMRAENKSLRYQNDGLLAYTLQRII